MIAIGASILSGLIYCAKRSVSKSLASNEIEFWCSGSPPVLRIEPTGGWTLDLSRRYESSDPGFKANAPDTGFANVSYSEYSDESSHQESALHF